jgi:hypothetical protein
MHKSFLPLFFVSLMGVLGTSFLPHDQGFYQWAGLISGVTPLALYHFLLSREKLLSPAEIDSIYYFGFLVTVITLVTTAISIALDTKKLDIQWILLQFGLGLVATGYALFARLLLMSQASSEVEMDVVEASQKLVVSVTEVSDKFNQAGFEAAAFVDLFKETVNEIINTGQKRFEDSLKQSLNTYTKTIEESSQKALLNCGETITVATDTFGTAISKVMEEMGRIQTEAQAISFAAAAERMEFFSEQIESSLQSITDKTQEASSASAAGISELASTTRKVQKLAIDIAAKLEKLEQLQQLLDTILSMSEAMSIFNESATQTSTSLHKLTAVSNEANRKLDSEVIQPLSESGVASGLLQLTKSLPENAGTLSTSLGDLSVQSTQLTKIISLHKASLEESLASVSKATNLDLNLKHLDETTRSITSALGELQSTIGSLKNNLNVVSDAAKNFSANSMTVTHSGNSV